MNKQEIFFDLLKKQIDLHKFADMKNYFIIAILGVIGWKIIPIINSLYMKIISCKNLLLSVIVILIMIILVISYLFSIFSIILSFMPQVKNGTNSSIFWGNAAKKTPEEVVKELMEIDDNKLLENILKDYQINSYITYKKFKYTKYGTIFMIIALISFILLYLFNYSI